MKSVNKLANYVIGHQKQRKQLMNLAADGHLPHAMLISGPEGVGKRRVVRELSATLLGVEHPQLSQDSAINEVLQGAHPDFHQVDKEVSKKEISVDSIREFISELQLRPYIAGKIVGVIDNAHLMSISAANSLLKTLEEPNSNVFLFLVSDAFHKLPETIVSRCQVVHFSDLDEGEVREVLKSSIGLNDSEITASLLALCGGGLAPLKLEAHVDVKTLQVSKDADFDAHLKGMQNLAEGLERELNNLFDSGFGEQAYGRIMSVASSYSEKDKIDSFWTMLKYLLRKKLRTGDGHEERWANTLDAVLEAEKKVRERNASGPLHASQALLAGLG